MAAIATFEFGGGGGGVIWLSKLLLFFLYNDILKEGNLDSLCYLKTV